MTNNRIGVLQILLLACGPATAQTYIFSDCFEGVTFQANISITNATGPQNAANARMYTYIVNGTYSMSVGGVTQTSSGLGTVGLLYNNPGVQGDPAVTQLRFEAPNAAGDGGPGRGVVAEGKAWGANLQGAGDLLPNGLPAVLPPITAWSVVTANYIFGDGKTIARFIDTLGACPTPAGNSPKALGDPTNGPGGCDCGDPIHLGTGNLFEQEADYQTYGQNKLSFVRYYNSMAASNTFAAALGANWRSNYDRYLRLNTATSVVAERPDGRQVTFTLVASNWITDTDVDLKLTNSGTTWTLTDSTDAVETYRNSGTTEALLQSIQARNGYTQQLQYGTGNLLSTVTDSYARQLALAYNSGKLQSVTTPDGLVLTYAFNGNRLTSVSYSTAPITTRQYVYENSAFPSALTGIVDENGNRYSTWAYDSKGRATSAQHSGGADLTGIAYNDTDGSRTVTNALGAQELYKFSILQGVPKVTEIDRLTAANLPAATEKITYDANGYVASRTDWNGNLTTFINNARGEATSVTEASGTPQARTRTISYLGTLHRPLQVVEPGITTTFTYDSSGNLLSRTRTDTTTTTVPYSTTGQKRTWTYTWSNSLIASVQTPRTDLASITRFTYDSSGAMAAITDPLGRSIRITAHTRGGLPETLADPNGVTTQFTYDARQRLLSRAVTTAAGILTTTYTYDAAGSLIGVAMPDASAITFSRDAAHRVTSYTDLPGQIVAYVLDALGNPLQSSLMDAGGTAQRMVSGLFDALGRMHQNTGGMGQITTLAYDSNNNTTSITDPLGHATRQAFDALNRRITITDAANGVSSTAFDAHDRPLRVTDSNGGVTTYVYDGFGELIQSVSPDSGTTVYRYDLDGNLTQRVDGAGATANLTYDALNRPLTVTYPADPAENVSNTYDQGNFGIGRLTGVTDAAGTMTRAYDERGNIVSETRRNGSATLVTSYAYDAASRIASIAYPSGYTLLYTRDAMGRITAVNSQSPAGDAPVPIVTAAAYQPFGPLNALTFGNGVSETRSYDLDYRLTNLSAAGVQNLSYAYDVADNVSSIADGVDSGSSQNFSYDALDRLTGAAGAYGAFTYTYDSVGNRVTQSLGGSTSTYTYNAKSNQLVSVAGDVTQSMNYSQAGNIANLGNSTLLYNQAGRLAGVMAGDKPVAQYTYDAFGQRLKRVGAVTATTLYQYDPQQRLLEETDDQGNPLVDYIYLDDRPVATISPADGQIYFLHDDRLGTPQAATDSSQNIVWSAGYGPFGETASVPALIVQNLRLPGQEFDMETGLHHNGFRDYAPAWGRYLQSDPIGLTGGMNTYAYAMANPVKRIDPLGLDGQPQEGPKKSIWERAAASVQQTVEWAVEEAADAEHWTHTEWSNFEAHHPCFVNFLNFVKELGSEFGDAVENLPFIKDLWDAFRHGDWTAWVSILNSAEQKRDKDPRVNNGTRCNDCQNPGIAPALNPSVP